MSNLYELTRKLVERGCPDHPRLTWADSQQTVYGEDSWVYGDPNGYDDHWPADPDDARAIWTMWAMEWWLKCAIMRSLHYAFDDAGTDADISIYAYNPERVKDGAGNPKKPVTVYVDNDPPVGSFTEGVVGEAPTILEAIEAATRHLH